jgi:hypothetical protein
MKWITENEVVVDRHSILKSQRMQLWNANFDTAPDRFFEALEQTNHVKYVSTA